VFTASLAKYADPLLDLMDATGCVRWRLFREACCPFEVRRRCTDVLGGRGGGSRGGGGGRAGGVWIHECGFTAWAMHACSWCGLCCGSCASPNPTQPQPQMHQQGNYVKDLLCLGRPLPSTIIVDNSPHSYIFQPDNAVPISTFIDNMEDQVGAMRDRISS